MTGGRGLLLAAFASALFAGSLRAQSDEAPRLSDEPAPLATERVPDRPALLLEHGSFLGPGPISEGFEIPTGARWNPALWIFGTSRSAVGHARVDSTELGEWVERLDLFANLQLSGTERILLGLRPLDEDGRFTGYRIQPARDDGFIDATNLDLSTLFLEGEIGEIFPRLDPLDSRRLDLGFSVGRQSLVVQEGLLIEDTVDAIGLTRNSIRLPGIPNLRISSLYAWGNLHRGEGRRDSDAHLFGLFSSFDLPSTTIDLDLAYLFDGGGPGVDSFHAAASAVSRFGALSTSLRLATSLSLGTESDRARRGTVLILELGGSPGGDDLLYLNTFWALDSFTSAVRDPGAGGPLGPIGLLFDAPDLGRIGSALDDRARDALGASLGYQRWFDRRRRQVVVEIGGRKETRGSSRGALGAAIRFQQAVGQHVVLLVDLSVARAERADTSFGSRLELIVKF